MTRPHRLNAKPKVLFACDDAEMRKTMWHAGVEHTLRQLGWRDRLIPEGRLSASRLADALPGIDVLVTTWGTPKLTEEVLSQADSLRIIAHAAGSVAFVATDAVWERGIAVTSANPVIAQSVAEYNLLMTLFGLRRIHEYAGSGDTVTWNRPAQRQRVRALQGSTVGIWGYGDVAKRLIEYLKPLQPTELLVCDDWLSEDEARKTHLERVGLRQLFERSDVLHLLQSLTPRTRGRIGETELASMKDGAVLVNSGRAHLVDREALCRELAVGRIFLVLDTLPEEPLPSTDPLFSYRNALLTPHIAGAGREDLFVPFVLEDAERLLRGETLRYGVTRERSQSMTQLAPERTEAPQTTHGDVKEGPLGRSHTHVR